MMEFNPKPSTIMHIDLNSCFTSIEQQANRRLRGRPVAVAAYNSPGGCILAASVEAKKLGIKTGMRVKEGRLLCPDLVVLEPDPEKYRFVHLKLKEVVERYTPAAFPRSIDEFVLDLEGCPAFKLGLFEVAKKLKSDIKRELGEFLTVSIGLAPNRFLAKTAAGLHKPDGLDEINQTNFQEIYRSLTLQELCGIAQNNAARLAGQGIYTVLDFYQANVDTLKRAFHSIGGYYWYLRLRGWEIDAVEFARRSFGNSYALPRPLTKPAELLPILAKLTEKMSFRLRNAGFKARGVGVYINYRSGNFWHKTRLMSEFLYESGDFFKSAYKILGHAPYREPVRVLAVSCFHLARAEIVQPDLFGIQEKKINLANSVDTINAKWGAFILGPASLLLARDNVKDRIAFGGVKELIG
ncbi:DNA polymerase IV [Patescibacteria group bacterium]|nr:DNA polymerase IV [Patescibacteria group bacterium]